MQKMKSLLLSVFLFMQLSTRNVLSWRNRTLVVSSILETPFLEMRIDSDLPLVGNDRFEGYIVDLMEEMSRIFRFNYTLRLVPDAKYGGPTPDGTWNGMIGELIREEVDIAAAALTTTYLRETVVDFSQPFMHLGIQGVMMKQSLSDIPSLLELPDREDYRIGVVAGGSTMALFRDSSIPFLSALWNKMEFAEPSTMVRSYNEGIQRARSDWNYIFFGETSMIEYFVQREPCILMIYGPILPSSEKNLGLAVKENNTDLLEHLNQGILKLQESAVLSLLYDKWWNRKAGNLCLP